ncbi:hypothetical protein O1611_g3734 [Lasiodiplodia mahajangana]|uniref:Uncharacterized protein n=1 Tax=Lasiodiplodia mahajangana TaxID=1108764 RepID=A0ACC2JQX2_9PEZI|nr:hypothetical protein O1611_g3734 [Lasiodiplodia mahajangana]
MGWADKYGKGDQPQNFQQVQIDNLDSLLESPLPIGHGRVLIIEDIHPSVVELLGTKLGIDPTFFADYILTKHDGIEKAPAPPSVAVPPSHVASQNDRFSIHFQKLVDLGTEETFRNSPWKFETSTNVSRSVRRLLPISGRQLGILRGCYSIFVKKLNPGKICLILADSTTPDVLLHRSCLCRVRLAPLHNGAEDFRTPISFSTFKTLQHQDALPSASASPVDMLQDLLSQDLRSHRTAFHSLLDLAYGPMRIVVCEWMLYCQVMSRYLAHYEYSFKDIEAAQSRFKIQSTKQFVTQQLSNEPIKSKCGTEWGPILKDLDYLTMEIQGHGESLERTIPVVASVLQILDSRRSIAEAVNVRRLIVIALVFVPLSFVAGLFSMADGYAPGQPKFWIYFAVSLPLTISICAFAFLGKYQLLPWCGRPGPVGVRSIA